MHLFGTYVAIALGPFNYSSDKDFSAFTNLRFWCGLFRVAKVDKYCAYIKSNNFSFKKFC